MLTCFLRIISLLAVSSITGVLGILWLFGDHASIWVTVAVKPFSVLMLLTSLVTYEQLRREFRIIEKREFKNNGNH